MLDCRITCRCMGTSVAEFEIALTHHRRRVVPIHRILHSPPLPGCAILRRPVTIPTPFRISDKPSFAGLGLSSFPRLSTVDALALDNDGPRRLGKPCEIRADSLGPSERGRTCEMRVAANEFGNLGVPEPASLPFENGMEDRVHDRVPKDSKREEVI